MKLCRDTEKPDDQPELICCQSRFTGVVRLVVFALILASPVVAGLTTRHTWLLWVGIPLFVLVIPLMAVDLAAQFRPTNWVLRIGPERIWINLRTYRDKPSQSPCVVVFDYRDIASAGQHTELYYTPSEMAGSGSRGAVGGSTVWRCHFLELRLNNHQTEELKSALTDLKSQATPSQKARPVWLVSPSVLRIAWTSGHGHMAAPRLGLALSHLENHIRIAEPTLNERPDWRKLAKDEVFELSRELVHVYGAGIEASTLLVRAANVTSAQAMTMVQQMPEPTPLA